jgi:Zn-finger nucleic acid-binding protein
VARVSRANSRELSRAPLQPTRLPLQQKARGARPSSRTIDCTPGLRHHSRVDAELLCPACRIPLTELRTGNGVIWRCEKCDGRAVGLQLLRRTFTPESINPLWLHAIHHEGRSARPCPSCGNATFEVALDNSSGIKVEVCRICEFVWFDASETQTLRARPLPEPKPEVVLPQEAREAIALAKVQQLAEQARGSDFDSAPPDERWKSIAAFFGMPVEFDAPAKKSRPAVT